MGRNVGKHFILLSLTNWNSNEKSICMEGIRKMNRFRIDSNMKRHQFATENFRIHSFANWNQRSMQRSSISENSLIWLTVISQFEMQFIRIDSNLRSLLYFANTIRNSESNNSSSSFSFNFPIETFRIHYHRYTLFYSHSLWFALAYWHMHNRSKANI